jgi:hypothetical protein
MLFIIVNRTLKSFNSIYHLCHFFLSKEILHCKNTQKHIQVRARTRTRLLRHSLWGVFVWVYVHVSVWAWECVCVHVCVSVSVCVCECVWVCASVWVFVCVWVCESVSMCVSACECVCECVLVGPWAWVPLTFLHPGLSFSLSPALSPPSSHFLDRTTVHSLVHILLDLFYTNINM